MNENFTEHSWLDIDMIRVMRVDVVHLVSTV